VPECFKGKLRTVAAFSPGVLGITGIETAEVIRGVAEKIRPDIIIAVDALAARNAARIHTTIQMTDTGVNPGAGVGNRRTPINRETMGIPVIAIGVPTVVDAATLVSDTIDKLLATMQNPHAWLDEKPTLENHGALHMFDGQDTAERHGLISELLAGENMYVTPKNVDAVIMRLSGIISGALSVALHPDISPQDMLQLH
jgi:spore protease